MARLLRKDEASSQRERTRAAKLSEVSERAARAASIVVRLPKDPAEVPGSPARAELLSEFGLTAAIEAEHMGAAELVAQTACFSAFWYSYAGGTWNRDGIYSPSAEEVRAIAAEELARVKRRR